MRPALTGMLAAAFPLLKWRRLFSQATTFPCALAQACKPSGKLLHDRWVGCVMEALELMRISFQIVQLALAGIQILDVSKALSPNSLKHTVPGNETGLKKKALSPVFA